MQIASSNSEESTTTDAKTSDGEAVKQLLLTADDLTQVKEILAQLEIEIPDSLHIEQGQTITLQQLTQTLSSEDLEKFTAALQQHLEQLPTENTEVSKFLSNLMTDSNSAASNTEKENSLVQLLQQLQTFQNKQAISNSEGSLKYPKMM